MSIDNNIHQFLSLAAQHGLGLDQEGRLSPRGEPDKKAIKIFAAFLQKNSHLLGERELNLVDKIIEQLKQRNSATLSSRVDKLCSLVESLRPPSVAPRISKEFSEYVPKGPSQSVQIDAKNKQELLGNLDDKTREKAEAALNTFKYVTFKEFLHGLEAATIDLCKNIEPNEKFVVLYDSAEGKSGLWTTKLAYEFMEKTGRKPFRIEGWSWFDNTGITEKEMQEYSDVTRIVLFDDASYSGTQMRRALEQKKGSLQHHFPKATVSVVVPYITDVALEHINDKQAEVKLDDLKPEFFFYEKMAPFPSQDLKFKCNNLDFKGEFDGITATYFQHKVAAGGHSTVPFIETGLIAKFQPPYK